MRTLILFLLFATAVSAQTVYKTPSGKKFHTANCHTVKNTSEAVSLADAIAKGLEPCKICKHAVGYSRAHAAGTTSGESQTSSQCRGLTKKGTRCRHMTKIGNGYCFQHQGQQ